MFQEKKCFSLNFKQETSEGFACHGGDTVISYAKYVTILVSNTL